MNRPIVLTIAGHDPIGGAGIQADIEAIGAFGCHAASVVTCLTVQDTRSVYRKVPVERSVVLESLQRIFSDLPITAVKIGLLGTAPIAETIADVLKSQPPLPVVLDPVLASGDGTPLGDRNLGEAILRRLFPLLALATPNSPEAQTLSGQEDLSECAHALLAYGADNVLITGGHESGEEIISRLYPAAGGCFEYKTRRMKGQYHGSGCTLSAAIAAGVARGKPIPKAVEMAHFYTQQALSHAEKPGRGQALPARLFSCEKWSDPR